MSNYLARLKEIEREKYLNNSLVTEASKVPEVPFVTFDTTTKAQNQKKTVSEIDALENKNISVLPTSEVSKVPKVAFVTSDTADQADSQKNLLLIQSWLFRIGEPEEDYCIVLEKCRNDPEAMAYFLEQAQDSKVFIEPNSDDRRKKVLVMLADNPDKQRAYITDDKVDTDNVILTVAIRDVASFEMLIPKVKYDPFVLLDLINRAIQ